MIQSSPSAPSMSNVRTGDVWARPYTGPGPAQSGTGLLYPVSDSVSVWCGAAWIVVWTATTGFDLANIAYVASVVPYTFFYNSIHSIPNGAYKQYDVCIDHHGEVYICDNLGNWISLSSPAQAQPKLQGLVTAASTNAAPWTINGQPVTAVPPGPGTSPGLGAFPSLGAQGVSTIYLANSNLGIPRFASIPSTALTVTSPLNGDVLVHVDLDGVVTMNPNYHPTEAAKQFWTNITAYNPNVLEARIKELEQKVAMYEAPVQSCVKAGSSLDPQSAYDRAMKMFP